MSAEIDIVLPLGSGSNHANLELRYALRSIWQHARGWRRVVIVGADPGFVAEHPQIAVVPCAEAEGNKEYRIAAKLAWAFQHAHLTDYAVLWNDDFVLLRKTDVRRIPFYQRGTLIEASFRHGPGRYKRALEATHQALVQTGRPALHYDLHLPMIYQRELFLDLAGWWERARQSGCGYVVKSSYANQVLPAPGPGAADCKLKGCRDAAHIDQRVKGRWLFSYSDQSLQGALLPWLRRRFPEPCPLERERAKPPRSGLQDYSRQKPTRAVQ
jgi:hypothetical protein